MEHKAQLSYSHSADYVYIEFALKSRWDSFEKLSIEFGSFKPRKIEEFAGERASELERLKILNPMSTEESLLRLIDSQISARADPAWQFHSQFADRVMAEYVTIAFLSHALCEAVINAILAIGLSANNAADLFEVLEHADIKEKWLIGPKSFHPTYLLPKTGSLYQALHHLTRQRNAFVHYKVELEMNGEKVLRGSRLERGSLREQLAWIGRFFSLPYDLAAHARTAMPEISPLLIPDRGPIRGTSPL